MSNKPLSGIRIVDFSQFLAGPACSLRLADLGAEVIKVERPITGDICRQLYVAKQKVGNESTIFHAINRNKKSVAIDLKKPQDKQKILELIGTADVVIQNFRPGVAERLGIDFDTLKKLNNRLVYGSVSGYGKEAGPWFDKPGQDLLAQSLSGLVWRNISSAQPAPMGLAIADLTAAYELAQGILALLVRRGKTQEGGLVEVSLIESLIGIQASALTNELNPDVFTETPDENIRGIYATKDGYISVGNHTVADFAEKFQLPDTLTRHDLPDVFKTQDTQQWIYQLIHAEILAEEPNNWHQLRASDHYKKLAFEQVTQDKQQHKVYTTRCPISIDGEAYYSPIGAPAIGEHNHLFWEN